MVRMPTKKRRTSGSQGMQLPNQYHSLKWAGAGRLSRLSDNDPVAPSLAFPGWALTCLDGAGNRHPKEPACSAGTRLFTPWLFHAVLLSLAVNGSIAEEKEEETSLSIIVSVKSRSPSKLLKSERERAVLWVFLSQEQHQPNKQKP